MSHQNSQSSQGQNHQPESAYSVTQGSRHIGSKGWPCWTSKGGEALFPGKDRCLSVWEGSQGPHTCEVQQNRTSYSSIIKYQ